MAYVPNIQSTKDVASKGVNMLVYGQAGAGKTSLIATLPKPIIISAEGGLLSISDHDIPFVEIRNLDDLRGVYSYVMNDGGAYESVAIDSLTEIAEIVLTTEKKNSKDPRQAYGALIDQMSLIVRNFRDMGKNVYMTAWLDRIKDDMTGAMLYGPSMPGSKLGQSIPHFFDIVAALRVERDQQGEIYRALMCQTDGHWSAKDRTNTLAMWEQLHLGDIINRIKLKWKEKS